MEHLSENNIKKAALRFLKTYYKFRPRTGESTFELDRTTKDGIIVDGYLSFPQEDQPDFLATFEATSREVQSEVLFKTQHKILAWDSIAIALLFTALISSYGYAYNHFTINQIGWAGSVALLSIIFGLVYFAYRYFFKDLKRYRYIYAIEQFKKYHADEQWIAIGEDVFDSSTDKNFIELKDQCILNGFGLISVNEDLESHLLITPSRQEVFGKKRNTKNIAGRDLAVKRSKRVRSAVFWNKTIAILTGNRSENPLLRYQKSFANQILLALLALFIIAGIFYKEAKDAEIVYLDEDKYEESLSVLASKTKKETSEFIIDSQYVEPFNGKVEPYPLEEQEGREEETVYVESPAERNHSEILVSTVDGNLVEYDCERFFSYTGTKYLIQDSEYQLLSKAEKRIMALKKLGINANCFWMGCVDSENLNYIVFVDLLFDEYEGAKRAARNFQRKFKQKTNQLKIRTITLDKP